MENQIDRKKVITYFVGKGIFPGVLLILLGFVVAVLGILLGFPPVVGIGLGAALIIAGIIVIMMLKTSADLPGQTEVDRAVEYENNLAKERALEKLNIIGEQVNSIEPVVIYGRGYQPEYISDAIRNNTLGKLLKSSKSSNKEDYSDPIYMHRIGADGRFRCSLLSTSVFMFGDTQLYIYHSSVDITTGEIYAEGTSEFFYSDISALKFYQEKEKIYNPKKDRFEGILFESVKIFSSGCSHTANISSDIDKGVIDREFTGMRNLIREKKNQA